MLILNKILSCEHCTRRTPEDQIDSTSPHMVRKNQALDGCDAAASQERYRLYVRTLDVIRSIPMDGLCLGCSKIAVDSFEVVL